MVVYKYIKHINCHNQHNTEHFQQLTAMLKSSSHTHIHTHTSIVATVHLEETCTAFEQDFFFFFKKGSRPEKETHIFTVTLKSSSYIFS